MAILVTGGAGYIGSVVVEQLISYKETVVVVDDLSQGHRQAIEEGVAFYHGDVGDRPLINRITREHKIEACVHFAALAYVGESVKNPMAYFKDNLEKGIALIGSLVRAGVLRFAFSSSCTVYGERDQMPIALKRRENGRRIPTGGPNYD